MSTVTQNVNLYLPEFRKKKHWLDAEKMVLLVGAAVLLLALVSGVEYFQLGQLRADLAAKSQQRQAAVAATAALRERFGVQTEDRSLLDDIAELEADLASKQALLQFLEGRELGNASGFSEHLADFSRYHLQGLSLSTISLTNGGRSVEFSGQVVKPELVTLYLQSLANGSSYAGMTFERLNIQDAPVTISTAAGSASNGLEVWNFQARSLKQ